MTAAFKASILAGFLAVGGPAATAATFPNLKEAAPVAGSNILQVHGYHERCARDRRGWHRHDFWGERRRCRRWNGSGRRPDFCVKIGPIWICDH